ncbi:MAG: 2-C-methyl-D-erythritol 4-phosphate cytidylyltransferase [Spirochaetota bacterium]|nr:2-C-methyl-D-erythritol 4-phosphate cytidylyltransferase [Spirochaetota bacterium]
MPRTFAIILAGGTGTRMGIGIPKQFLSLAGKPVIVHTIQSFQKHPKIDNILVVIHPDYIDKINSYKQEYSLSKIKGIIPGGKTRQDSSYNAITGYDFLDDDILLFHDAVRPFIDNDIIGRSIEGTLAYGAIDVCVSTTDTIVQSNSNDIIESIPDRSVLRNGQTPQGFRYDIIKKAHDEARLQKFTSTTDDVRLVLNIGHPVKTVRGSFENMKITNANDMILSDAIALSKKKIKVFNVIKYSLTEPGVFSKIIEDKELISKDTIAVRPTKTSICQADLRYFLGKRKPEILALKLPMALLHEGIGVVEHSNDNSLLNDGDRVIIIPNIPGCVYEPETYNTLTPPCSFCGADYIYENHCKYVRFLSSGCDGLSQSHIFHPVKCLMKIDDDIPDDIAVMSELLTVAYNAVKRINLKRKSDIVIFGDGPVGYMTAIIIHKIFNFAKSQINLIGMDNLDRFNFVTTYSFNQIDSLSLTPDYIFECVGGDASEQVINKSIELINPAGKIILMGVSENNIPIDTRDILEKGITMIGSSRSSRYDYVDIYNSLRDPEIQQLIREIIIDKKFIIKSTDDLKDAFNYTAKKKEWGKVLLEMQL